MTSRFFFSPRYVVDIGGHVFPTRKFGQVAEVLKAYAEPVEPGLPERAELTLAHTEAWTDKVISGKMSLEDETLMELPFSPKISVAHQLSVSGTLLACREALKSGLGLHAGGGSHHAFAGHGEGFCVLNDLAVAALKVIEEGLIKRAAVIDLDVHQGNGTAAILAGEARVFTFSMHQEDIYPEKKEKSDLDVGLRKGTGDDAYLKKLEENLPKVLMKGPQLVLYQAGVDCAENDVLGGLRLTREGLKARDNMVFKACRRKNVPVAVTLGGGYSADLRETSLLHVQTMLEALKVLGTKAGIPSPRP